MTLWQREYNEDMASGKHERGQLKKLGDQDITDTLNNTLMEAQADILQDRERVVKESGFC